MTTSGLLIIIGVIIDKGAKDIAILWSLYVSIQTSDFKFELFLNSIDSSVILTESTSNFSISFLRANNLSVSLIFNVCNPLKVQSTPRPKQVITIVWARSGLSFRLIEILSGSLIFFFFKCILFSLKTVLTPSFLYISTNLESPCILFLKKVERVISQ